ncbi:MAG: MBL fold metallo-hydrolase, partial [Pseudomonadota bacterium]
EIVPGVRFHASNGHTPGHMSLIVESEGEVMLITGDALNHPYVSFEHPDWHFGFDTDREMAAATRRRLLDMLATDRMTIASYHLPFPGIGHAQRAGDAYRYLPASWIWNAD